MRELLLEPVSARTRDRSRLMKRGAVAEVSPRTLGELNQNHRACNKPG